jgi:hypothetical protein
MKFFRFFLPGFQQNWKVVMLSVIGAATFWFFNAMNKDYDTRLDYPLKYEFERDSVVLMKPLADKIKIDVSSGGWNLIRRTLRISATPIVISLENPTEIKYLTRSSLIPLITDQLGGLKLTYVVTDTLFFDIQQRIVKKLPVIIDSLGIPLRENFRLTSSITLSNDSVLVTGPKSLMTTGMPNIELAFDDDEIDNDFNRYLGYHVEPLIIVEPDETRVSFEVSQFLLKELTIPIEFLNFPDDSSIFVTNKDIKVYFTINENHEDEVDETDFSVTADLTMLNPKDSTLAPLLMYAHDKALDIVLSIDRVKISYKKI